MADTSNIELLDSAWTPILTVDDGPAVIQLSHTASIKISAHNAAPDASDTDGVIMSTAGIKQITVDAIGAGGTIYARSVRGTSSVTVMSLGV